jgi:peptidyl-prolyl cis-trans isomerase SurA
MLLKRVVLLLALVVCFTAGLGAQTSDPVLFTVEDVPVHVSEFSYIYAKTNGKNADFSRKSLEEYLDLYVKFKLKVRKAKEMQIDTISTLREELEGYRRQLADSYLVDREVTDKLVREAYNHIQQDVDLHHIFFAIGGSGSPADTLQRYNDAIEILQKIKAGAPFEEMAKAHSDDKSALQNGGHVGYITAVFPPGMHTLEQAAYTIPLNTLVGPVRTTGGYHLLKIGGRRAARGEMEIAHILVRKLEGNEEEAKTRIDSIYKAYLDGTPFEELAAFSEDRNSGPRGGYLGFFGINRYELIFENAAFALENDGDVTVPFESSAGWHIVKQISKRGIQSFEIEKARLENRIKNDDRFEVARTTMLQNIKRNNNFSENKELLTNFVATLDESFLTFRWKPSENQSSEPLFSLGNKLVVTLSDFEAFLGQSTRKRLRYNGSAAPSDVARLLYTEYVDEMCLRFEEDQLMDKYPDFRGLMREYEEGILLFEATKMEVWDKASSDTIGLDKFFNEFLQGKYRWDERAEIQHWQVQPELKDQIGDILKMMSKSPPSKILQRFNAKGKTLLSMETRSYERTKAPAGFEEPNWRVGAMSAAVEDPQSKVWSFSRLENIIPPADKKLKEARGYIVADYQDYLEQQWLTQLRSDYVVKIDYAVLETLIKS